MTAARMKSKPVSRCSAHAIDAPAPWSVEVLALHWLRVIDADGNDVLLIGDVRKPGVRELGEAIAKARGDA